MYNPGYHITADSALCFRIGDGTNGAQKTSTIPVNDGKWHLGTITFNRAGNGSIYIDGNFNTSQSITSIGAINGGNATTIGAGAGGGYHRFTGLIDTVRYYSDVLPNAQIKQQYYAGLNNLLASGSISIKEYQSRLLLISKK